MDHLYQALKELCKAVLNLIVAVLDLFSGILNGIACLFEHLKFPSGHFQKIRERNINGQKASKETAAPDSDGLQLIRTELKEQITGRDSYIQVYCNTLQKGKQILPISTVLFAALLGIILLLGMTGISGGAWLILAIVILVSALALCFVIIHASHENKKNRLILFLLEHEFSHYLQEAEEEPAAEMQESHLSETPAATEAPTEMLS